MRPSARSLRWILGGVGLLVLVGLAWCGFRVYQVYRELDAASDAAAQLQSALAAGDDTARDAAVADLRDHSAEADNLSSGPTWSFLTHVPWLGDDARGVRTVSGVLDELSGDTLDSLVEASADLNGLAPKDGEVSLQQVRSLQAPVADAATALEQAATDLEVEDPAGFNDRLGSKYRDLEARVSDAADALSSADTTLQVLPTMLGADGPRNYLLVFQNNAEIRATGGLPGSVSMITVDDGAFELTRQVAGSAIPETDEPVLPLTPAEDQIYGIGLGTFFVDANFTSDYPRAAEMMQAHWQREYPDDDIDGVISLDTVALSYILESTGPIDVGDQQLTADSLVDELLHETYLRISDPAEQDEFFAGVAQAGFDVATAGTGDPATFVSALARGASEERILVHSFDDEVQADLDGTAVAGELVTDPDAGPQVGFTLNDTTAAKMSYYLRYEVTANSTSCSPSGAQTITGSAKMSSVAPDDAAEQPNYITGGGQFGTAAGDQLVTVRLIGPVGGEISEVTFAASPVKPTVFRQDGRPVALLLVQLGPGQTEDVGWTMTSGEGQEGDVDVTVTPSIEEGAASSTVASEC